MRRRSPGLSLVAFSAFLLMCRDATQVFVEVTTDIPCDKHGGTSITVGRIGELDSLTPTTISTTCTSGGTVGTLVIVPGGANDEEIAFQVTTGIGVDPSTCTGPTSPKACIIARRALRYLPHESLRVRVPMKAACAGVSCEPTSTCFAGACVSATLDPERCSRVGCGEETLSPVTTSPIDGGAAVPDAGGSVPVPVVEAGPPAESGTPVGTTLPPPRVKVAIGDAHACALRDGLVYCWGQNDKGQVGNGTSSPSVPQPTPVVGALGPLPAFQAISVQGETSGALSDTGDLYMWGSNEASQIGYGLMTSYEKPLAVSVAPLRRFCLGPTHMAGVELDDTTLHLLGVWYSTASGQELAPYTLVDKISALGCGKDVTTTLLANGAVYTTGDTNSGNLGRTGVSIDPTQVLLGGATLWMGSADTIVRTNASTLLGWGTNGAHHLGPGNAMMTPAVLPPTSLTYSSFANGDSFHCALRDPDVWCVGSNANGTLGSDGSDTTSPLRVPLKGRAVAVWAGTTAACATLEDGDVWCWGNNTSGMLGGGLPSSFDAGAGVSTKPVRVNLP